MKLQEYLRLRSDLGVLDYISVYAKYSGERLRTIGPLVWLSIIRAAIPTGCWSVTSRFRSNSCLLEFILFWNVEPAFSFQKTKVSVWKMIKVAGVSISLNKMLKEEATLSRFLQRDLTFMTSCFLFYTPSPFRNEVYSERKCFPVRKAVCQQGWQKCQERHFASLESIFTS